MVSGGRRGSTSLGLTQYLGACPAGMILCVHDGAGPQAADGIQGPEQGVPKSFPGKRLLLGSEGCWGSQKTSCWYLCAVT